MFYAFLYGLYLICDTGAQLRLDGELRIGHVKIDEWLKKNSLPRLPLPNVCGYIPLVRHLTKKLRRPGAPTLAPVSHMYRETVTSSTSTKVNDFIWLLSCAVLLLCCPLSCFVLS